MTSSLTSRVLPWLGAALLGLTLGANAAAAQPLSYRCTIGGDTSACDILASMHEEVMSEVTRPGSYALYLIHLGRNADQAVAEARRIGEQPQMLQMMVRMIPLDSLERYERLQGHRGRG